MAECQCKNVKLFLLQSRIWEISLVYSLYWSISILFVFWDLRALFQQISFGAGFEEENSTISNCVKNNNQDEKVNRAMHVLKMR